MEALPARARNLRRAHHLHPFNTDGGLDSRRTPEHQGHNGGGGAASDCAPGREGKERAEPRAQLRAKAHSAEELRGGTQAIDAVSPEPKDTDEIENKKSNNSNVKRRIQTGTVQA